MDETINLDVHAINDLKTRGLPLTDDHSKYNYSSDANGTYSKFNLDIQTITVCTMVSVLMVT